MIVRPRLTNLALFVVLFLSAAVQPSRALPASSPTSTATPTAPAAPTGASPTPASATATLPLSMTAPISTTGTPIVTTTTASPSAATPTSIALATDPLSAASSTPTDTTPTTPTTIAVGSSTISGVLPTTTRAATAAPTYPAASAKMLTVRAAAMASLATGTITTVVGTGIAGYGGDGGLATQAAISVPQGMAMDSVGDLFIADSANNVVREVISPTGVITTIAGTGSAGYGGDGGPAAHAQLNYPTNLAIDGAGDLFIADSLNNRVREVIAATGVITTVAGSGASACTGRPTAACPVGDGGPATRAEIDYPAGMALDNVGNLYITEFQGQRIREVVAATGIISTVAGIGGTGYSGDGGSAAAAQLYYPWAVARDAAGDLYIADGGNHVVREVSGSSGVITTAVGTGVTGDGGDGGPASQAQLNVPRGLTFDGAGNLFIADRNGNVIREVLAGSSVIVTVAGTGSGGYGGDGGPAAQAQFSAPRVVLVDGARNLFIADSGNNRVREVAGIAGRTDVVANANDSGLGSLRATIAGAGSTDVIAFAPQLGPITLTSGELLLSTNITINGSSGSTQVVSGGGASRVFEVGYGVTATLANLTITGGHAPDGVGNGVASAGGGGVLNHGALLISRSVITGNAGGAGGTGDDFVPGGAGGVGGIASYGSLTIISSTVANNTGGKGGSGGIAVHVDIAPRGISPSDCTSNGTPGGNGGDGGITASGRLTIIASAVTGNSGGVGGKNGYSCEYGGAGGNGGIGTGTGYYCAAFLTISNSTIAGNVGAASGYDSSGAGGAGGIANACSAATIGIGNSTITSNTGGSGPGVGGAGGISSSTSITVSDSIIASNASASTPDCAGTIASQDYNLIGNPAGCTLTGATAHTITGTNPLLGPLQNNGGSTATEALQAGSPAIDQIPVTLCGVTTDQRGAARPYPVGGLCDIGAYEYGATPPFTPSGSPTPTPTPVGSPTPIPNNTPTPTNTPLGSGVVPWHPHYTVPLGDRMAARVDLSDGHVDVSVDAMHLAGRSPGLAVAQTWDSGLAGGPTPLDTGAGPGWVSTLTPRIGGVLTRTVTVTDETGAAWPLTYTGALSATGPYTAYSPPPGLPWQLTTALSATGATPAYTLTDFLDGSALTFDARGRLLARLDSYGNSSALTYGGGTVPLTLTNSGRSIVMGYTGTRPSDVQSPLWRASGGAQGQHVAYGYNGYGQLSSVTWGAGTAAPQTATFAYHGNYLTSIATPLGNTWAITYANGNYPEVSDIASPPGRTPQGVAIPAYDTNFSYQTVGTTPLSNLTFVTTGYGSTKPVTTMYSMDGQGNLTGVTDALYDNTTNLTYDADHDVTSSTDALGHRTAYAYRYVGPPGTSLTTTGLLTQTVRPPVQTYLAVGSSLTPLTTTYAYDPTSDDLIETDLPAGGRTLYGYDGHHSVSSVIQELGGGAGSGGCASPNAVRTASPNAVRTASASRVRAAVTVRLAGCGTPQAIWRGSMTTYNAYGERVSAVDPRGVTVLPTSGGITPTATLSASAPSYTRSYAYSPQGDLTAASSPPISTTLGPNSPVTTLYAPDADGHVATVTSPNGAATRLGYDPLGRTVAITQPAVRIFDGSAASPAAQIIYDGDGNVAQTVDPAGGVNTRAYDPLGRTVYVADPVGDTTLLTYTASALVAAQDPVGNVTGNAYDPAGRPTGTTDGTGVTTSAALDAMGNTTALTTPQTYAGPSPTTVDHRGYDALNRLILDTVQGSGGATPTQTRTTATGYGPDGTVAQVQDPNGNLVVSGYDLADRFAGNTIYPAGSTTPLAGQNLTLDGANNLVEELDFTERDHARTFDGANRLLTRADCWAACPSANAVSTALSYDGNGNVVALTRQDGAGATAHSALTYNAADWLTAQSDLLDGSDQTLYGYDAAGRLRTQSLLGRTGVVTATLDAAGRATRIDENVSSGATAPPAPVGATCPTGWTCADIGNPALAGGQSLSGGTWTVQGSGDLYGSSDAFHFAWQPMLGDGSVSARVVTQTTGASPYAKAGVMLRQDTTAGAPFYDAYVAPSGFVDVLYRPTAGAATVDLGGVGGGAPVYLKVARVGGSYTAYTSSDGLSWAAVSGSTVSIAMTGTALGGLAVAANSTSALSTAQFDAVTLVTQTATTLGNAQVGASQDSYDSYNMDGSTVTTGPRGARITAMTAYVGAIDPTAANDLFQTAIYSDSNGSPGALVAASASGRLTANSWNSVALSATLAPSTTYWLVYNANGSASQYDNLAYDTGPAGSGVYATNANQAYGAWPASFGAATSITDRYSLYATSSGGAASGGLGATLGYTRTGSSQDSYDSYNMDGSKVTTGPQGGPVVSVSAYVGAIDPTAANDLFQVAIYADSNGSPGALVAASASGTLVANSWNTVALTATLAPNTTYWLMYNANGSASQYDNLAYDNGPAGSGAYYAPANQAYGVWPASFGMSAGVGTLYSLYATLAAPGGPTPTPTPSPTGTPSATATPTGTQSAGAGTPGATSLFGYTADDRPLTATLGAGTANVQEQRFYDGDNRLTCLQAQGPQGDAVSTLRQAYAYGYSPLGVTTVISTYAGATAATTCGGSAPAVQALAPDAFGRLAASGGITWTYDGNDNLTSITRDPRLGGTAPLSLTYAYTNPDGSLPAGALPNELLALRYGGQPNGPIAAAYGYDRSGDTVAITTVNATAGTTTTRALAYDATGRLTGVSSTDGLSVTVGYNARGLRASVAVSDAHPDKGGPASFVERMTYRGDRLGQVAVQEGTASFTETFLYRPDGEPLELLYQGQGQGVPSRYYYAVDGRGDVTALVNAQGQVVDQYGYDLWGAATAASGGAGALGLVVEGVPQPLRYRGYVYNAWYDGAGLWSNGEYVSKGDRPLPWYWLGVRSYDPV